MRIAFLYGRFSIGNRPLDFDNLYTSPRGLTGSELSCIEYAQAMRDRGHEVTLVVGQPMLPREWEGITVCQLDNPKIVDEHDAVCSWNEPNLFFEASDKPLRLVNQQLNDFGYCRPGWEEKVDVVTSPSGHHLEFLKQQRRPEFGGCYADTVKAWDVLPNGCDPALYEERARIPGRVVWASSADRGLHRLLEAWPAIKHRVPNASLRAFYNFTANDFDELEALGPNIGPDLLEIAQRKRYIRHAMAKLAGPTWDVEHVGSISRDRMAREWEQSSVLGYPCDTIRYCVTGDTLVDTQMGLRRIDELRDVEGVRVASTNGAYAPVGKWFDSGTRPVFEVRTRHGYSVTGTDNHPLLVLTKNLSLEWREIADLRADDHVCVNRAATTFPARLFFEPFTYDRPQVTSKPEPKTLPAEMSPELATILGYLVSEGAIGTHQIMFCNKDREVLNDFDACWAKCFPDTRLHAFDDRPDDTPRREVHSQYVISFLRQIGLEPGDAYSKKVPWAIMRADRESVAAFISAYFEGDGTASKYSAHVVSVSNELLRDVQLLLLKFGIISVFHAREDEDRLGYVKVSGGTNLAAFAEHVGFRSSRKRNKAQATDVYSRPKLDKIPFVREAVEQLLRDRWVGEAEHNQTKYRTDDGGVAISSPLQVFGGGVGSALTIRDSILACAERIAPISASLAQKMRDLCAMPYLFDPLVESPRRIGERPTYDLSVPGTRAFTGNGIICHNTEGFSVTTMEACASGCLPVITDIDSLGHIYGEAVPMVRLDGGGLTGEKLREFVDLVVRGLVDETWRKERAEACQAFAKRFAWPALAARLEAIVEEGIDRKRGGAKRKKGASGMIGAQLSERL